MKLTIGDTVYDFEYKLNSMCELEREAGMVPVGAVLSMPQFTMFRFMLWAGLLKHHAMPLDQAGDLAEAYAAKHGTDGLLKVITDAISDAGFMMAQGQKKATK